MNPNRQRFAHNRPAPGTPLRSSGGIDLDDLGTGAFGLVLDHLGQHPERGIGRCLRQVAVLDHEGQGQIFQRDQARAVDDFAAEFVELVSAPTGDAFVMAGNALMCLPPPPRSLDPPAGSALQSPELGLSLSVVIHAPRHRAVVKGDGARQPQVNADLSALGSQGGVGKLDRKLDIPAIQPANDARLLDCGIERDWAMPLDLDTPGALDVQPTSSNPDALVVREGHRPPAEPVLETRETRPLPRRVCLQESTERLVQSPEHLLASMSRERPEKGGGVSQIAPIGLLRIQPDSVPPLPSVRLDPLLQRQKRGDGQVLQSNVSRDWRLFVGVTR